MKELIGVTFHFNDGSVQKVPVSALMGGGGGGRKGKYNWLNEPECPDHGRWDYVPAGTRKDGSTYNAFWTCSDDNCLNRPSRDWSDGIDPDAYVNGDSGTMDESLPF